MIAISHFQRAPLAAALCLALAASANAATIAVNDASEGRVAGKCTLLDAVAALNTAAAVNACSAGNGSNDTIDLSAFTSPTTINLALAPADGVSAFVITKPATISAPLGADGSPLVTLARSTVSGTPGFRLIATSSNLTISGLALTGGSSADQGGAVYASGYASLTLNHAIVSGNYAHTSGGGVATDCGNITLNQSVVSTNLASKNGGGIYAANHLKTGAYFCSSVATVTDSTISGNVTMDNGGGAYLFNATFNADHATIDNNSTQFGYGGGVYSYKQLTITRSTVSNNVAKAAGGGVQGPNVVSDSSTFIGNQSQSGGAIAGQNANLLNSTFTGNNAVLYGAINVQMLTINFCTISGNTGANYSGGLRFFSGLFVNNSIITGNSGGDVYGSAAIIGDHNIIGVLNGHATLPADTKNCDAKLAALAYNGGPTRTMALGAGSCAIDAGTPTPGASIRFDQRGTPFIRKAGVAADIGAFEVQPGDRVFADGFGG